jgi:hypothetical protein
MILFEILYYYGTTIKVQELYANSIREVIDIIECNSDIFNDIDNILCIRKVKI